jgi:putative membrane protein
MVEVANIDPLRTIHLNEAEHLLVTQAVAHAENNSDGEIVTIAADHSGEYRDVAFAWATIVAFLALSAMCLFPAFYHGIIDWALGGWHDPISANEYLAIIAIVVSIKWVAMRLLMNWMPLRLALTPSSIKQARVRERANDLFRVGAESRTRAKTAVLIYLSMREHRAEIIADSAISAKVAPEKWGDAMIALISNVRAGEAGKGMAEAVRQVGLLLAEHFPRSDDDRNELPDRLIEL